MSPIATASGSIPNQNGLPPKPAAQTPPTAQQQGGRRHQLYGLLKQVEHLQGQISRIPAGKARHHVKPYIKLGQASNLNLNPQSSSVAEKIVETEISRKKEEIQRQA